jgi:hypothetical protein
MLKSYFPSNIDKNKILSFFKNNDTKNKIQDIIDNTIIKNQINEQFEELIGQKLNINNNSLQTINKVFNSVDEMIDYAKKNGLQSFTGNYGEPINKEQIDYITQHNKDLKDLAIKRDENIKAINAKIEASNKAQRAANPSYTGPGIRTSGVSIDSPYFGTSPAPTHQATQLEKIPDPIYLSFSGSFQNNNLNENILNDYIYNTLLNHYLILFGY